MIDWTVGLKAALVPYWKATFADVPLALTAPWSVAPEFETAVAYCVVTVGGAKVVSVNVGPVTIPPGPVAMVR